MSKRQGSGDQYVNSWARYLLSSTEYLYYLHHFQALGEGMIADSLYAVANAVLTTTLNWHVGDLRPALLYDRNQ